MRAYWCGPGDECSSTLKKQEEKAAEIVNYENSYKVCGEQQMNFIMLMHKS